MKRNIWLIMIIGLLLINIVIAEESGGLLIGKQKNCIQLPQECADCSYITLTSIQYPNMTREYIDVTMTKQGTSFNYSFCKTQDLGIYSYCVVGDVEGTDTVACKDFEITPSGTEINGWRITIQIFVSLSTLFLMILFLYLSGSGIKSGMAKAEQGASRFFFIGLSLVFLIAHIIITNVIVHDTLGVSSSMASVYTSVMYIFFTIIIWEIDIFLRSKGRR